MMHQIENPHEKTNSYGILYLNKSINETLIMTIIAPNEQIVVGKSDSQLSFEQKAGVPQYVSSIQVIDGFTELHKIRSYHGS